MQEMTEILDRVSEISKRTASVQALVSKISAMTEESFNEVDAVLLLFILFLNKRL